MDIYLRKDDEYIKLGQAMKKAGLAMSGAEASALIGESKVRVNGETETRRGRKLYEGDTFVFETEQVTVKK